MASAKESFANFEQFQINGKPITKLKVDELKQELITRGLEKSGLKRELQERLYEVLVKEKNAAENSSSSEEKPSIKSHETPNQEVSSTTIDIQEMPSVADAPIDSNGQNEAEAKENKINSVEENKENSIENKENSVENNEENKDEKKSNEAETTENKKNETEELEDGEIVVQEEEKKKLAVPEKRRRLSRQTSNNPPTPGTRKRKWGSNKQKSSVVITTDSLKELIPGVQLASTPALEAVMELDDDKDEEEEGKSEKQADEKEQENEKTRTNKLDEKSPYKRRIVQVADSKTVKLAQVVDEAEADKEDSDVIIIEPKQSRVDTPSGTGSHDDNQSLATPPSSETTTPVKREVSPPRNPPSCAIHVSNLVRPFTQKLLMQYLSEFGAVTEEGFWMNKIKSHCYVIYPSVDEATNARQSLHGQRWPATSPRTLRVDFAVNDKMLEETDGALGKKVEESPEEKKENVDDEKERSRSKEKSSRKHKEKKEEKKKDEPSAANLLDKLFRKTTAMPCIYWLPLTNEQIVMKEKEREERRKKRELERQEDKPGDPNPRDAARRPQDREKPQDRGNPRETERPKVREMARDQDRRPLRDNRGSSPPPRPRPDRRSSPPAKRRSRSRSPAFRRPPNRRR